MPLAGDHDRNLPVAHVLHAGERVLVAGDVHHRIVDAFAVEGTGGGGALDAGGLAVDGDVHFGLDLVAPGTGMSTFTRRGGETTSGDLPSPRNRSPAGHPAGGD